MSTMDDVTEPDASTGKAMDRRVRRSRRLLQDTLVRMALSEGFGSLTVEKILTAADVGRATFYAHYRDKNQLLADVVRELFADLEDHARPHSADAAAGFTGVPLRTIFELAESQQDRYMLVLSGAGDGEALRLFEDWLAEWAREVFAARSSHHHTVPRISLDLMGRVWAGEVIAVLRAWLRTDSRERPAPAVITQQLRDLTIEGRRWAMGYEPGH